MGLMADGAECQTYHAIYEGRGGNVHDQVLWNGKQVTL
jgi:hypothetical protein